MTTSVNILCSPWEIELYVVDDIAGRNLAQAVWAEFFQNLFLVVRRFEADPRPVVWGAYEFDASSFEGVFDSVDCFWRCIWDVRVCFYSPNRFFR
jgi:hypothetical protein